MKNSKDRESLLAQFKKTPIVQVACQRTGIHRATYYRWRQTDDAFARAADEALQEGLEVINDMAESQLIASIRDGAIGAWSFWLKHRHPAYSTRIQVEAARPDEPLTQEQEAAVEAALRLADKAEASDEPK